MGGPLYGLGALGASLLVHTVTLWLFPFYVAAESHRLPAQLVGLALAVGRLANSVGDVLVARWSDAAVTRWGRRRPFLILGSPLLGACFALVWVPPPQGTAAYLAAVLAGFFTLFAGVVNPYLALMADLPEPSRLAAAGWQAAGSLLGTAVAYALSAPVIGRYGYSGMAALFGTASVLFLWACALSAREPTGVAARLSLPQALSALARSAALRAYLTGLALAWVGLSMVSLVLVLLVTVLMGLPTSAAPAVLSAALASTAVCLPAVVRWGRRTGPQQALQSCLVVAGAFLPLVSFLGRLPGSPQLVGYALVLLSGLPLAALYALPNAVLAQLAARQGLPALHFGLQGLVLNLANAVAAAAVGLLLGLGHAPGDDLGLRLVPACAALLVVAGLLAFRTLGYSWPTTAGS